MGQLNGGGNVYLPDYTVRQLTHLQIIKVTSASATERWVLNVGVCFCWFW